MTIDTSETETTDGAAEVAPASGRSSMVPNDGIVSSDGQQQEVSNYSGRRQAAKSTAETTTGEVRGRRYTDSGRTQTSRGRQPPDATDLLVQTADSGSNVRCRPAANVSLVAVSIYRCVRCSGAAVANIC